MSLVLPLSLSSIIVSISINFSFQYQYQDQHNTKRRRFKNDDEDQEEASVREWLVEGGRCCSLFLHRLVLVASCFFFYRLELEGENLCHYLSILPSAPCAAVATTASIWQPTAQINAVGGLAPSPRSRAVWESHPLKTPSTLLAGRASRPPHQSPVWEPCPRRHGWFQPFSRHCTPWQLGTEAIRAAAVGQEHPDRPRELWCCVFKRRYLEQYTLRPTQCALALEDLRPLMVAGGLPLRRKYSFHKDTRRVTLVSHQVW